MYGLEVFPDVAGGHAADTRWPPDGTTDDAAPALRALGAVSLALGFVGVFLPLLPTTPFVLLAAWAFARSSPRLRAWLETHPRLGPPLLDWERRRAVPRRAKVAAVVSLSASWLIVAAVAHQAIVAAAAGALMLGVAVWLVSRPS